MHTITVFAARLCWPRLCRPVRKPSSVGNWRACRCTYVFTRLSRALGSFLLIGAYSSLWCCFRPEAQRNGVSLALTVSRIESQRNGCPVCTCTCPCVYTCISGQRAKWAWCLSLSLYIYIYICIYIYIYVYIYIYIYIRPCPGVGSRSSSSRQLAHHQPVAARAVGDSLSSALPAAAPSRCATGGQSIYLYVCVCIICIYIYIYIYVYIYIYICAHIIGMYVSLSLSLYIYIYIYVYRERCIHTYTYYE